MKLHRISDDSPRTNAGASRKAERNVPVQAVSRRLRPSPRLSMFTAALWSRSRTMPQGRPIHPLIKTEGLSGSSPVKIIGEFEPDSNSPIMFIYANLYSEGAISQLPTAQAAVPTRDADWYYEARIVPSSLAAGSFEGKSGNQRRMRARSSGSTSQEPKWVMSISAPSR